MKFYKWVWSKICHSPSVLLWQLEYSKLPGIKYLFTYFAIIFCWNVAAFSSPQLTFCFDPKVANRRVYDNYEIFPVEE